MIAPLLLAASLSTAQMMAPQSVSNLVEAFNEAYEPAAKAQFLAQIARTQPTTPHDVQALYDVFVRYPADPVRQTMLDSLDLIDPRTEDLQPIFLAFLRQPDPEAVLFGIRGALKLRSAAALPLVEKLAKKPFSPADPEQTANLSKKKLWWDQFQALEALAQWRPQEAKPLVLDRSRKSPRLASILARRYWKDALPLLRQWSAGDDADRERAERALRTDDVPQAALREARPEMLAALRDAAAADELRHQLALKVGLSSTEEDVSALLKEYPGIADPKTKVYFAAALFASRSAQVVPLLVDYAQKDSEPARRAGARVELKELMEPAKYREIVHWAAQNDSDAGNRDQAARELAELDAATAPAPAH